MFPKVYDQLEELLAIIRAHRTNVVVTKNTATGYPQDGKDYSDPATVWYQTIELEYDGATARRAYHMTYRNGVQISASEDGVKA